MKISQNKTSDNYSKVTIVNILTMSVCLVLFLNTGITYAEPTVDLTQIDNISNLNSNYNPGTVPEGYWAAPAQDFSVPQYKLQNLTPITSNDPVIPKATVINESGASNATANKSNTGATAAVSPASNSTQGAGTCVAGAMLARLLTSSITSAVGGLTSKATGITETATHIPVTNIGTQGARNQEATTNAHTGMFLFGIQTGVSWDSVAYCIVNTIIDYIVNSTIAWANSGFKGNPAFIRNPEQFFKQLADREASAFIQELAYDTTGLNVCKPFRVVIATGLAGSYSKMNGNYQNSCSLTQMQQNMMQSGKYTITTPTDWIALTKPQNNAYYSYISAGEELNKRIAIKNNTATLDLTLNRGFLSKKKCKDDSKPESKTNPCDTTTPGSVIADSLSQTLNIPKERLVSAQKFDQMVDAIVNNLIKIALSKALEGVTGQAPSAAVASDYYSTVANNATYGAGSNTYNMPVGAGGTTGTGGAMLQDILNGATFSNPDWNAYALQQIVSVGLANIPVRDASKFFPGGTPTAEGYLSIMAAIAQKESGGLAKPARYLETQIGAGNTYSVGLMSLTPGDYGTNGMTYDDLENPYTNIRVAVGIMGMLLRKHGVISGPPASGTPAGTGLSAYWSTLKYSN